MKIPEPKSGKPKTFPLQARGTTPTVDIPCPVCSLGARPCSVVAFNGRIDGISSSTNSRLFFRVTKDDLTPVILKVHSCWEDFVTRLKPWLEQNQSVPFRILHLEKEGDSLCIGEDSLLIIEPDWLINVTDMARVEYCQRQLLIERFLSNPSSEHLIRGNTVHRLFPDIWDFKRGRELEERCQELFLDQVEDFLYTGSHPGDIKPKCDQAIDHLTRWVDERPHQTSLRTETFVLSPGLGIKGRIDFLWESNPGQSVVGIGELKTGKSQGVNPKPGDALQLLSYTLMLFARGEIRFDDIRALLLYSGNDIRNENSRNLYRRLTPHLQDVKKAIKIRNDLVLADLTGRAQFQTNMNKCRACNRLKSHCALITLLSDDKDTRAIDATTWLPEADVAPSQLERELFQHYSQLIFAELKALKETHAALWRRTPEEREAQGIAFRSARCLILEQTKGRYRYRLEGHNTSELRTGDTILISDQRGPALGRVALGMLVETTNDGLVISSTEEVGFVPVWVDQYTNEELTIRLFKGLYRWISNRIASHDTIFGIQAPSFGDLPLSVETFTEIVRQERLNKYQVQALRATVCTDSYCLVHGPPGSGKTRLISSIVEAYSRLDKRVLVCTGTNRALDEAMKPLAQGPMKDRSVRLGTQPSITDPHVRLIGLQHLIKDYPTIEAKISAGGKALENSSVVGVTSSSLLSGRFDRILGGFDLVVVDEAAQLTVPGTLGCLSFGSRFVLIGDHHQLPAVVQSEGFGAVEPLSGTGAWACLSKSLFEILYERAVQNRGQELVVLQDQYRMNEEICSIPGTLWYAGQLRPATREVADARLDVVTETAVSLSAEILDPQKSVVFVDVPVDVTSCGSRTNRIEALVVCDLVKTLIRGQFPLERKDAMAVICPRRAQVELIRRELEILLKEKILGHEAVAKAIVDSVSTVDRFQGSQCDLVIMSLGVADNLVSEHLSDERRLNVAISRARHKLILVGNYTILNEVDMFHRLFQLINTHLSYTEVTG